MRERRPELSVVQERARGADVHRSGTGSEADAQAENGVDQEFLALERELAVFLRRARASSGEMARAVHPGLEPAAYGLLVRLEAAGPQRATDLAGYFGVGRATMSRQLRGLEEVGLVAREPDPGDGRASLVRLTEEGRERFGRVRDARRERYVRKLAGWDRAEVAELARLLHQLNARSGETF
ncbi:MarR family winged helix-turn-helix transcriptional regulator [Streptomyces sp. NPDC057638]|uniref:MarR family winged helix-turn-helix transcriptional regulator n=1 Tax=Streptomyces sp. NPDC057638 TaxID=3346190 RepID=UPI0036BFD5BC